MESKELITVAPETVSELFITENAETEVAELEELFSDRFTEKDEEYQHFVKLELSPPPCVSGWGKYQRDGQQFNRKRPHPGDHGSSGSQSDNAYYRRRQNDSYRHNSFNRDGYHSGSGEKVPRHGNYAQPNYTRHSNHSSHMELGHSRACDR